VAGKWRPSTGSSIPLHNQDLSILAMAALMSRVEKRIVTEREQQLYA